MTPQASNRICTSFSRSSSSNTRYWFYRLRHPPGAHRWKAPTERFFVKPCISNTVKGLIISNTKMRRNIVLAGESELTRKVSGGLSVRAEAFRGIEDERNVSLR